MPFELRYRVYWSETDAAGIAHFTNILKIIEKAEEDLYRSKGLYNVQKDLPMRLVVKEVYAKFKSPLRWNDEVSVRVELEESRTRGLKYRFEIVNITTNSLAAEGYIVLVCTKDEGGSLKATPCPKELIEVWKSTKNT
jgi:acyl-CoA thioester hydrolase